MALDRSSVPLMARVVDGKFVTGGEPVAQSAAERAQVFEAWNATAAEFPIGACVHELFEAQAARTPRAVAVVAESEAARLTYGELNAQANRLAHHLRALGVGPDRRVAVCMERSPELIVALIAVLKAGGAYVPLDPAYPAERLRYMLADSAPVTLLTQGSQRAMFAGSGVPTFDVSAPTWENAPDTNVDRVSSALTPDHAAYVMYTSGSTGLPKGAIAAHRGVVNLVHWYARECAFSERDVVLIITSHSFDLTQRNLFGPLVVGGRVCLASESFDPQRILALIAGAGVTFMNVTPTAFNALIDESRGGELAGVRLVALGGEAARPEKLAQLAEPRPDCMNVYGPTECSGMSVYHRLSPDLTAYLGRSVTLGRPIANARIYVLDALGEPAPAGVCGEIHIGGVPVGPGYLNRPGLTADQFVPDPFAAEAGARMYRTGTSGGGVLTGISSSWRAPTSR